MQTLHVITNQQHLEPARLPGRVAVVLDVIFATTTIALTLAAGARSVIPVSEVEDARRFGSRPDTLLAGEKDAVVPPGFLHFAPNVLLGTDLVGKDLVLATTNGTVALAASARAARVYAAALVNAGAVAERLLRRHPEGTLLLVCSASRHRFNIEDFVGAGVLVDRLEGAAPGRFALTDAALAARHLATTCDLPRILHDSRVGRMMRGMGLSADVDLAARIDNCEVVPELLEGSLRPA